MSVSTTTIERIAWGEHDGKPVFLFRLRNSSGSYAEVTNYGATLVSVFVPDRSGRFANVILGYPELEGYVADTCYIGVTIGRFANRIRGATFTLDGVAYNLDRNDGNNTNHGGAHGFHSKVFDHAIEDDAVVLTLASRAGEGGFPGNVNFSVAYALRDDNSLAIHFAASADQRTVVNFTNHAYFDLSAGRSTIHNHRLVIRADTILQTNDEYIPTGIVLPAGDRRFDGHRLSDRFTRQRNGVVAGLNTYYIFDQQHQPSSPACVLVDDVSGRVMNVFTSYPGVQLYTGDFLDSNTVGDRGRPHQPFDGLCLECQYFPDSPNHRHFPSTVIGPGQEYREFIIYRFSTGADNGRLHEYSSV